MTLNTENIRALYAHYEGQKLNPKTAVAHIRILLEEIQTLKNGHITEPCNHTDPYIPGGQDTHYHRCYETYCDAWEDWTHS